jgi:hypothetical protein
VAELGKGFPVAYDRNNTSPSAAVGAPNATDAAASSIRAVTWPYRRYADQGLPPKILLRPPDPPPASDDPTITAIVAVHDALDRIDRSMRLLSAPWLVMPPDGESFHKGGGIPMPAADGLFHVVVTVTCPPGRNGVLNRIANVVVGGAWSDFSGDAIWQITRNQSTDPTQTMAERNYEDIEASYGLISAPAPIAPIRIFENDVLSFVIKNVALPAAGEEVGALLGGFFYPRTWDDQWDAQNQNISW